MHYPTLVLTFSSVVPLKGVLKLKVVPLSPSHHQDAKIFAVICLTSQVHSALHDLTISHKFLLVTFTVDEKYTILVKYRPNNYVWLAVLAFFSFFLSFGPASEVPKLTHYGMVLFQTRA